jgi:hypothetical protein
MKRILFVILAVFLLTDAFPQSNDKEKYFTMQISMLMGSRQISELSSNSFKTRFELQVSPSITITKGRIFNEHWAAGIGAGFEIFDHNHFPVFADVRYTLWNSNVSPFFAFKTGHAFGNFKKKHYDNLTLVHEPYQVSNVDFRNYGGLMLHPEMGVKIPISEKADLLLTIAYRYQKTKSMVFTPSYEQFFDEWKFKGSMYRLSFGLAVMFR